MKEKLVFMNHSTHTCVDKIEEKNVQNSIAAHGLQRRNENHHLSFPVLTEGAFELDVIDYLGFPY